MATEGASAEPGSGSQEDAEAARREFDVDNLSKPELRMLLSVMEGELEARDLVIEALRVCLYLQPICKRDHAPP